jgi:hypothetical protein
MAILTCNHIDDDNKYTISIDIETGIFKATYTIRGVYHTTNYPLGTTRTDIRKQLDKLFEGVSDD